MDYLLAILLPPVAVLMKGRPGQAALNFFLTLCFWFPGSIHACMVVADANANRRHREMMRAMPQQQAYDHAAWEKWERDRQYERDYAAWYESQQRQP